MAILNQNGEPWGFNTDGGYTDALANFGAGNALTGLGTGRDKTAWISLLNTPLLSPTARCALVESSHLCRNTVFVYPNEAAASWAEFTADDNAGFEPQSLSEYWGRMGGGSIQDAFRIASIEGRWHGDGYILLSVDDGRDWADPIDWDNIRSMEWFEGLYHYEVIPAQHVNPSHFNVSISRPSDSSQKVEERTTGPMLALKVHRDRLLRFSGHELTGLSLQKTSGRNNSVLQAMIEGFSRWLQGHQASSAMLSDYSVFRYKLKGLAAAMQRENSDHLTERFLQIQMGMSVVKGLMFDAEHEDADFVNRNYSGVDKINDSLLEALVASQDLPREKLLNAQAQSGLGGEGRGVESRFRWAQQLKAWRESNWRAPLMHLARISLSAADGPTAGEMPQGFRLDFPSAVPLSRLEEAELRDKASQTHERDIRSGVLSPHEVRSSAYSGAFSLEVTLDESYTSLVEERAFNEPLLPPTPKPSAKEDQNQDALAPTQALTEAQWRVLAQITAADYIRTAQDIASAQNADE